MNTLMTKTEDLTNGINELMELLCKQMTASSIAEMSEDDLKLMQAVIKLAKTSNEVLKGQATLLNDMNDKLDKILLKD